MNQSQILRSVQGATVASTTTRTAIIRSPANNTTQWSNPVSASTRSVKPGDSTIIDVKNNSDVIEQQLGHYLKYGIRNNHATDTLTIPHIGYTVSDLNIIPNDSDKKIELHQNNRNSSQIVEICSDSYFQHGLQIYENTFLERKTLLPTTNITVPPLSTTTIYLPLDWFLSFRGYVVRGEIRSLRIEPTFTAEQSNIENTAYMFKCSSTNNLWTRANIDITDICYVRQYNILANPSLGVSLLNGIDKSTPLRVTLLKSQDVEVYSGVWNTSTTPLIVKKLSDLYKIPKIQYISPFLKKICTALNDTQAGLTYSGSNYIGFKWRELNTSNERQLDLTTDLLLLQHHEITQYQNEFAKQLPPEIFTDPANDFRNRFLRASRIYFDYMKLDGTHELVRNLNSNVQDYDITIVPTSNTLTGNYKCFISVVYVEEMEFNKTTGQLVAVN